MEDFDVFQQERKTIESNLHTIYDLHNKMGQAISVGLHDHFFRYARELADVLKSNDIPSALLYDYLEPHPADRVLDMLPQYVRDSVSQTELTEGHLERLAEFLNEIHEHMSALKPLFLDYHRAEVKRIATESLFKQVRHVSNPKILDILRNAVHHEYVNVPALIGMLQEHHVEKAFERYARGQFELAIPHLVFLSRIREMFPNLHGADRKRITALATKLLELHRSGLVYMDAGTVDAISSLARD